MRIMPGFAGAAGLGAASARLARRTVLALSLAATAAPVTLGLYVALTLVSATVPVAIAWFTKVLLDSLIHHAAVHTLMSLGVVLAMAGTAGTAAPQAMRYLKGQLDREIGLCAQGRLFSAVGAFTGIERFENPRFLDRLRLAQQASRATASQVVDSVLGICQGVITIAGFLGSLSVVSPVMAPFVLASGTPTLIAEIVISRRQARMLWRISPIERRESFYGSVLSSVASAKEVRLFGIGSFLQERMLSERRAANSAKRALDRQELLLQAGPGLLTALVGGVGLLWAIAEARTGTLSVGGIAMFAAAMAGVQGALAGLAISAAAAHKSLLMFDHYLAVTTAGPDLPVAVAPEPLLPLCGGIELRDVWFRYSVGHPWVLRGVNLYIPHGKAIALVGLNGSGKSTLVKLLCRFYDPERGAILWDGIDLRDVDPSELRRRIGVVFQDYMHYDMTAAENIGLGDIDSLGNRSRIQRAAMRAGIHRKIIELPRGYDTLLSRMFFTEADKDDPDTGVFLSGGQQQRLALARAMFRDLCDFMILDEPSAGLDAEAEHQIHMSLLEQRSGKTSLLISHRLGAVRDADMIVVLRDGEIVERGDHSSLLAMGREYARLFTLQASNYQPETENSRTLSGISP